MNNSLECGSRDDSKCYTRVVNSKKKRKDNTIGRPLNCFLVYSKTERRRIQQQHPRMLQTRISEILGARWKSLSKEEKGKYQDKAKHLNRLHKVEFPDYTYRPRRRASTKSACPVGNGRDLVNNDVRDTPRPNSHRNASKLQIPNVPMKTHEDTAVHTSQHSTVDSHVSNDSVETSQTSTTVETAPSTESENSADFTPDDVTVRYVGDFDTPRSPPAPRRNVRRLLPFHLTTNIPNMNPGDYQISSDYPEIAPPGETRFWCPSIGSLPLEPLPIDTLLREWGADEGYIYGSEDDNV